MINKIKKKFSLFLLVIGLLITGANNINASGNVQINANGPMASVSWNGSVQLTQAIIRGGGFDWYCVQSALTFPSGQTFNWQEVSTDQGLWNLLRYGYSLSNANTNTGYMERQTAVWSYLATRAGNASFTFSGFTVNVASTRQNSNVNRMVQHGLDNQTAHSTNISVNSASTTWNASIGRNITSNIRVDGFPGNFNLTGLPSGVDVRNTNNQVISASNIASGTTFRLSAPAGVNISSSTITARPTTATREIGIRASITNTAVQDTVRLGRRDPIGPNTFTFSSSRTLANAHISKTLQDHTGSRSATNADNVQFTLYNGHGATGSAVSTVRVGDDGFARWTDLAPNTQFSIRESRSSDGFMRDERIHNFTTSANGSHHVNNATAVINYSYGRATLRKQMLPIGSPAYAPQTADGVVYTLYEENQTTVNQVVTVNNGVAVFTGLDHNTIYYARETATKEGYILDPTFHRIESQRATDFQVNDGEIITNYHYGEVELAKQLNDRAFYHTPMYFDNTSATLYRVNNDDGVPYYRTEDGLPRLFRTELGALVKSPQLRYPSREEMIENELFGNEYEYSYMLYDYLMLEDYVLDEDGNKIPIADENGNEPFIDGIITNEIRTLNDGIRLNNEENPTQISIDNGLNWIDINEDGLTYTIDNETLSIWTITTETSEGQVVNTEWTETYEREEQRVLDEETGLYIVVARRDEEGTILFDTATTPFNMPSQTVMENQYNALAEHGVEFTLFAEDKETEIETGLVDNGLLRFEGLHHNTTYWIRETKTQDGFVIDENWYEVNAERSTRIYINDGEPLVNNRDDSYIEVSKFDTTGMIGLDGAVIQLLDEDMNVLDEQISSSTKIMRFVVESSGNYFLKEISSPTGYDLLETLIPIIIDDMGQVLHVPVLNYISTTEVELEKRSTRTEELLADAHKSLSLVEPDELGLFTLIKDNEVIITDKYEYVSREDSAHTVTLFYGGHQLQEDIAPFGHDIKLEPLLFDIDGSEDSKTVTLYNNQIIEDMEFSKVDITGDDELPGAEICIFKVDGSEFWYRDGDTGNEYTDSRFCWTSTETNKPISLFHGDYLLEEVIAPKGFLRLEQLIPFTVSADGVTQIKVPNEPLNYTRTGGLTEEVQSIEQRIARFISEISLEVLFTKN